MQQKAIFFYRYDFSEEAWKKICDEFEADYDAKSISCVVDISSLSQDI